MLTLLKPPSATNILIVDDNPDNLRLLAKLLESQGYIVRKSLNGKMALRGIQYDLPDLILLDITMPEMSGYEVCQQLKATPTTAQIPIIFISALDCISDKVQAFEIGGQDYITKPFQELEVVIRVRNQLLIQQQHQQLIEQNQRLEQEIKERLRAEDEVSQSLAEIRRLSLTDELTGLYNRRGFFLLGEQQLRSSQRTKIPCCLLFADIDGLKQTNDYFGHQIGDQLISDAAQILKQTFRQADIVARLGGDEFAVLIPACSENIEDFQNRLQTNIDQFNQKNQNFYQVSMSIGVHMCIIQDEMFLENLLSEADQLMYKHKRWKRSEIRFSSS